jgi:Glyoxalase-like domain
VAAAADPTPSWSGLGLASPGRPSSSSGSREPRVGKARVHLDIVVTDLGAATRRALALGASIAEDLASEDPLAGDA